MAGSKANPKKRPGFGEKAGQQLEGGVSMSLLLSENGEEDLLEQPEKPGTPGHKVEVKPPKSKNEKTQKRNEELTRQEEEEKIEPPEELERHSYYFRRSLEDKMVLFTRQVREKNLNRFMRVLLHDFFDKPIEKQEETYREGLEKYWDLVNERDLKKP